MVLNLQSASDISSFNLNGVYDVRSVMWLTTESEAGTFLTAMLGWDPRPSIEQVVVWFAHAIPVTAAFFWPARKVRPPTATTSPSPTTAPSPV